MFEHELMERLLGVRRSGPPWGIMAPKTGRLEHLLQDYMFLNQKHFSRTFKERTIYTIDVVMCSNCNWYHMQMYYIE